MMITLGTFNIRVDTAIDGLHRFNRRKDAIVSQFSQEHPSIMGLQEVNNSMLYVLKESLPQYEWIGCGRNKDFSGEHNPIAYLKDELTLCSSETFWLSPKPALPGSRYFLQSPYPRICTWAKFRHPKSGRVFRFYNTHLDHISSYARKKGILQILQAISHHQKQEGLPFFLVGDFNLKPYKKEYKLFKSSPILLKNIVTDLSYTYHGFRKNRGSSAIDYIFTNIEKQSFPLAIWEKSPKGDFLSDHLGLIVSWDIGK